MSKDVISELMPGFRMVTTVVELEAVIARLPKDARSGMAIIAVNEVTNEVAVVRQAADGSWQAERFACGPTASSTH